MPDKPHSYNVLNLANVVCPMCSHITNCWSWCQSSSPMRELFFPVVCFFYENLEMLLDICHGNAILFQRGIYCLYANNCIFLFILSYIDVEKAC